MRTIAPSVARVVVPYAILAGVWIHASDRLLEAATGDPHVLARWSIYKGWAFVGFTALLLALLMGAELRARRLNEALLGAQRDLLERIARGTPAPEILRRLVVLIESQVPGLTASVRLLDAQGSRAPHAVAGRLPTALVRYLDEQPIDEGAGPSGIAMFRGDTVLVADLASDPAWARHRQPFEQAGLRAAWATPLRSADGRVLGSVSCYHGTPGLPDSRHLKLIELATQVAAVALAREQQDNAVRASERRLSFALEVSRTGGWELDLVDHSASRTLEHDRIFGYQAMLPEWTYEMFLAHVLEPDRAVVDRRFQDAVAHQTDWSFECRIRRVDGEVRWIWAAGGHQFEGEGPPRRMAGIVQDITDRKRAEEAVRRLADDLRRQAAELERRVAERTAELSEARDRAEGADRLKSAFLATMSHELRTPLNSIIGFTGVLLQGLAGPLNEEQRKQLGMVRGSGQHLLELINDVLDISKIEAGQLELAQARFDPAAAARRAADTVAAQAAEKGLAMECDTAPGLPELVGDRRRVEQVLINLLANAVKFTDQGRVGLDVRATPEGVAFVVSDTGIGIPAEAHDQLFQPFRQLDSGLARAHEGTGLGLAICKRLVERMGGRIGFDSAPGVGSTFRVDLPLTPPPLTETP